MSHINQRRIGITRSSDGMGLRIIVIRDGYRAIRLHYDRGGHIIDYHYEMDNILAGVEYCTIHGGLKQSLLWDAYDKCSIDTTVLKMKRREFISKWKD